MAMQRQRLVAGLMLMIASAAQAQQPALSRTALITAALDADAAVALANVVTDRNRAQIHVGSTVDAPFLRDITMRINDTEPVRYELSDTESRAIQHGAQYRIVLAGVKDGINQLHVEFHTYNAADKGIGVFKQGQLVKKFSGDAASTMGLALVKGGLTSDPSFDVSIPESSTGSIAAQIGEADFLMADGEYFPAASILTRLLATGKDVQFAEAINKRLNTCRTALALQAPGVAVTAQGSSDPVMRFNQALALVQQDKGQEAITALDDIGRTESTDSSILTLRDQANLVLAYYFLDHSMGIEAIPVFERIRSPGPYANAGLLGLGWALLQPPHREGTAGTARIPTTARYPTIVTPRLTADIVTLKQEQAPRIPSASKDQQIALRKALVPWTELTGRDPTDPAVQEGMLAIAWTLYHFGAYDQAQDSYRRAADQLDKIRGWYDRAIENIRSGGMASTIASRYSMKDSGWSRASVTLPPARAHWWHGDTPETPRIIADNFYFERLLLNDDFAEALQAYRNLMLADSAIRDDIAQLGSTDSGNTLRNQIAALSPALSVEIAAQRAQLESIAIADLVAQKSKLEKYLIEARFALATIYDRPELVSAQ